MGNGKIKAFIVGLQFCMLFEKEGNNAWTSTVASEHKGGDLVL